MEVEDIKPTENKIEIMLHQVCLEYECTALVFQIRALILGTEV